MVIIDYVVELLFVKSVITLLFLVGTIILAGFILGLLKNVISRYLQYALGWGAIVVTGWIGTPIHELGHAAMCVLFGHRINSMKLFPSGDDTKLGYVQHSYNKHNIYHKIGNFFIGIGPIISGTLVILVLLKLLLPIQFTEITNLIKIYSYSEIFSDKVLDDLLSIPGKLFNIFFVLQNLTTAKFWIFMLLSISVASHMALSGSDMKGAFSGLISLYLIAIITNLILPIFESKMNQIINIMILYNSYLLFSLTIAIFCSICAAVFSILLYGLTSSMSR